MVLPTLMSTLYERELGAQPLLYGIGGIDPSDPDLVKVYDLLPSQPCSRNNVLITVVPLKTKKMYWQHKLVVQIQYFVIS